MGEHDGIWIPDSAMAEVVKSAEPEGTRVLVDNRTDLPDADLLDHFEENTAAFGWGDQTEFSIYNGAYGDAGSLLGRRKFQPPANVIEEIKLARELAEKDDDVAGTMQAMIAAAFSEGFQNQHTDEQVEHTFDEMTEDRNLLGSLAEMYREWLIAGQVNTVTLFVRANYDIRPEGVSRVLNRAVAAPMIGVLPAERIRVLGNDVFGNGELVYVPTGQLESWLREFHAKGTSAARRAELARQDPVSAALFTGAVQVPYNEEDLFSTGMTVYRLNTAMAQRTTMPKGSWKYPRPLLTRNFALLEAKRLLNLMDFALLQGGTNFIVVAKKGSEKQPATPPELANLKEIVRRASKSGALIGDHRVEIEVVQPDLGELLNPAKRQMLGRKLSQALLRVPEFGSDDTGQAVATFTELAARVITQDRLALRDHIHRHIWKRTMTRNEVVFGRNKRPMLWFPKVILQGLQFWTDYLLKMYDRGDLPRKWMVEFGGFNYDATVAQKKRENSANHDNVFTPPAVPFSSPSNRGPQDNGGGRPPGSGPNNGGPNSSPSPQRSPSRPTRVIRRTPGETVRAHWSEEHEAVVRIGDLTEAIIREYPASEIGRLTSLEQSCLASRQVERAGPTSVIPVNTDIMTTDERVVNLEDGLRLVTGRRVPDGAVMARAVTFREPRWDLQAAEDTVLRWGYEIPADDGGGGPEQQVSCPDCGTAQPAAGPCVNCGYSGAPFYPTQGTHPSHYRRHHHAAEAIEIHIHADGRTTRKTIERGPDGEITSVVEEPVEPEES